MASPLQWLRLQCNHGVIGLVWGNVRDRLQPQPPIHAGNIVARMQALAQAGNRGQVERILEARNDYTAP